MGLRHFLPSSPVMNSTSSVSLPSLHNWATHLPTAFPHGPTFPLCGPPLILPKSSPPPETGESSSASLSPPRGPISPSSTSAEGLKSEETLRASASLPKKTKRGRKPCANPTPQALRQRAYRLRKQMKKHQAMKEQTPPPPSTSPSATRLLPSHVDREELRAAEILLQLGHSC